MPNVLSKTRPWMVVTACGLAVLLAATCADLPLSAGTKEKPKSLRGKKSATSRAQTQEEDESEDEDGQTADSKRIRLTYQRAAWKKVLTDVKIPVKVKPTQEQRTEAVKQAFSKLFTGSGSGSGALLGGVRWRRFMPIDAAAPTATSASTPRAKPQVSSIS